MPTLRLRWLLPALVLWLSFPAHAAADGAAADGATADGAPPTADVEALEEQAFQQAAALAAPCVVRIETIGGLQQLAPGLSASAVTSGVIVSADGEIVTSAFTFAAKPSSIVVTLADGRRFPARKIATDRQRMITLLKIDATGLPAARPAPRSSFRVGQWSLALGRTFDADHVNVSVGVISALDRIWGKALQSDAKISPVNYGGPLIDIEGRVLGILAPLSPQASGETAGVEWYDSGIGFAVPLVDLLDRLPALRGGEDLFPGLMGVTFRGRASITAQPVVDRVRLNSPAAQAGLKKDDRIVAVDGTPVETVAQVRHILGRKYAGESLEVQVVRGTERLTLRMTLAAELPPYEAGFLGILPARHTEAEAPPPVRFVLPDSPAAEIGLQPHDQIVKWNDQDVSSTSQLADLVSRLPPGATAQLTYRRGETAHTADVKLAAYPSTVPAQVPAAVFPNVSAGTVPQGTTGRRQETLPGHNRTYWMYVPETYRPDRPQGVMVFLHPSGQPLEAAVLRAWKAECDRRGIILVAPQCETPRGWNPNDLEFVHDVLAKVRADLAVDPARIWVQAVGDAGPFAALWAFRERSVVKGLALIEAPLSAELPEHDPEARQQFYVACDPQFAGRRSVMQFVDALRKARYPTVFSQTEKGEAAYLPEAAVAELARWADSLDRI